METFTFKTTINCGSCIAAVTPKLAEVQGIDTWKVDTNQPNKILTVQSSGASKQDIMSAVQSAGYSIEEL